jgi:hypothetical protein
MSLVDQLLATRTPLELAKELAATAKDNAALCERVARLETELFWLKVPQECEWKPIDPDFDYPSWESACGHAWSFNDGGPVENHVAFCQGCGKPVKLEVES